MSDPVQIIPQDTDGTVPPVQNRSAKSRTITFASPGGTNASRLRKIFESRSANGPKGGNAQEDTQWDMGFGGGDW